MGRLKLSPNIWKSGRRRANNIMQRSLILLILAATVTCSSVAQSQGDLERISAKSIVYVRNGVSITPTFNVDGQICVAILQPNRALGRTVHMGPQWLTADQIEQTLDVLVPAKDRGERTQFWGFGLATGQDIETSYNYEKVHVTLYTAIGWRSPLQRTEDARPDETSQSKTLFAPAHAGRSPGRTVTVHQTESNETFTNRNT